MRKVNNITTKGLVGYFIDAVNKKVTEVPLPIPWDDEAKEIKKMLGFESIEVVNAGPNLEMWVDANAIYRKDGLQGCFRHQNNIYISNALILGVENEQVVNPTSLFGGYAV